MSTRQKNNKRSREQGANATRDYSNEPTEVEFKFLKAPKRGTQQAKQLLAFDDHIDWLEIKIKKEFGDISCLVKGRDPSPILDPVAVGERIRNEFLATPTGTARNRPANQVTMTQARFDRETSKAVDARDERRQDISKALGVILETIDNSFRKYWKRTPAAEAAYNSNDIKTIMIHLGIWYREALGSTATDTIAVSEADIKKANDMFEYLKQNKNQSLEDFKKDFDSHVNIYEQTTGNVLPEHRRAYRFLSKLYKPKYGDWFNKLEAYDATFNIIKVKKPNLVKDETKGVPTSLDVAYALAAAQEAETAKQERIAAAKRARDDKDDQEQKAPEGGQSSYAGIKGKNKSGKLNFDKNKNKQKKSHPPGTKPSEVGLDPCYHKGHKPTDDRDHLFHECPLFKKTKVSYTAEQPQPVDCSRTFYP